MDFKAAMGKAEQAFYASGTLTTPPIFELPKGRTFDVSFDVTPATCKDKKQDLPVDDTAKTYLTYKYGQKVFDIYHPTYNQAWIPVSPCGVYVEKSFDQTNRVISISVRNTFQDRVVSDVHVIEVVGPDVGHLIGEATPFSYQGERQVVWPHYPKGESWRTDGVEWRLFSGHFVGGTQFTPYPPIGWQVTTHSYIPEGKQVEFRLPIYAKPSAAGKTNVLLNKGNVVDIESGVVPVILLSHSVRGGQNQVGASRRLRIPLHLRIGQRHRLVGPAARHRPVAGPVRAGPEARVALQPLDPSSGAGGRIRFCQAPGRCGYAGPAATCTVTAA